MYLLWDHNMFNNNNNNNNNNKYSYITALLLRRPNTSITMHLTPNIVVSVAVMSRTSIQERDVHSLQYRVHSLSISWFFWPPSCFHRDVTLT